MIIGRSPGDFQLMVNLGALGEELDPKGSSSCTKGRLLLREWRTPAGGFSKSSVGVSR